MEYNTKTPKKPIFDEARKYHLLDIFTMFPPWKLTFHDHNYEKITAHVLDCIHQIPF